MKNQTLGSVMTLVLTLLSAASFAATSAFPTCPDTALTPGSLCTTPTEHRYNERIAYCKRNVDPSEKSRVISTYDTVLGYQIQTMNRNEFKIDHLIPLCFGGSNEPTNLWPQHKTVYEQTDPIENKLCQLLQKGRVTQQQAIASILDVKHDLSKAEALNKSLDAQLGSH